MVPHTKALTQNVTLHNHFESN